MNALYVVGGIALTLFGIWETIYMVMKIARNGTGVLGAKIQLLGAGIMSIVLGIALIVHYI
jgi:hypothetical protein